MGYVSRLSRPDRTPAVKQVEAELEAALPDGWRIVDFRAVLFGRLPVKLRAHGVTVEDPGSRQHLAVASGDHGAVLALRGALDVAYGRVEHTPRWAPPVFRPSAHERNPAQLELLDADSPEEEERRAQARALLPPGSTVTNADGESFLHVEIEGVTAQLPEGWGVAGLGSTRAEAWLALAERLNGSLQESPVWFPPIKA